MEAAVAFKATARFVPSDKHHEASLLRAFVCSIVYTG